MFFKIQDRLSIYWRLYSSKKKMKIKDEDQIIKQIKDLFEISDSKKLDINSDITKLVDFDSLNKLKLIGFIDEKTKKKIKIDNISKIKKIKHVIKIIND
ncbi:hypothetical protein B5L73_01380 [Candidatus Pelagibacter sp. RS39]|nr:hypothetical protein B5L73_01380 [Candidatus Pelagibacter sp. RS39]